MPGIIIPNVITFDDRSVLFRSLSQNLIARSFNVCVVQPIPVTVSIYRYARHSRLPTTELLLRPGRNHRIILD